MCLCIGKFLLIYYNRALYENVDEGSLSTTYSSFLVDICRRLNSSLPLLHDLFYNYM